MYCEKCGASVRPEHEFCGQCGHPLRKQDNTQSKVSRNEDNIVSDDTRSELKQKKTKVPFYISWPFICVLFLVAVYIIFFIPVPCVLAVLRILHNKKHAEFKLSRIKNIWLICIVCLLGVSYAGSIMMYADDKKTDKIFSAIEASDFNHAAELMSEYYGETPDNVSECDVYYQYYLAQGDYEKSADVYLSYFEEYPADASDFLLGKIDELADNLSDDTITRLSAVRKTVADLQTTATTEKSTKAETTTVAGNADKTEKTTKAEAEKTTKAKTEKTTKAEKKKLSFFEKRKIDKEFKKELFDGIEILYPELSDAGKEYAVGKAEEYIRNRFSQTDYNLTETESIRTVLSRFSSAGMSSELIRSAENTVTVLNNYKKMHSDLPLSYRGPIPSDAQEELLDVYLKQRVEIDGEKRYYVAYTGYNNYYGTILPDADSEIIIICSQEPLSEGVNRLYAVRNGTYDTISDRGFEQTHRLFYIYTYEQWEEYNSAAYYSEIRKALNDSINEIEEKASASLAKGDVKGADKAVGSAVEMYCNSVLCGNWGDENSMRCFMNIYRSDGNFDIEISWSSGASATTVWNFKGTYDKKTNTIVYKNGTRTEIDSSGYTENKTVVYSDGTGSLYFENNELKWKDNKQSVGDDCRFRK